MKEWNVVISRKRVFMGSKGFELLDMFKWEIIKLHISKDCLS